MILEALHRVGGLDYLARQAEQNPKTFLLLLGRVLPLQVTGDAEFPIQIVRWAVESEATQDPSRKLLSHTAPDQSGDLSTIQNPDGVLQ